MKAIIQKVKYANVVIEGEVKGAIDQGYMILVGFKNEDNHEIIEKMCDKIIHLRINEDDQGKMNRSLLDTQGAILSISQFTLYAQAKKGRRPSFIEAAKPEISSPLYDDFNQTLRGKGIHVETGIFGADMKIRLLNDGPVTIILDSAELFNN